MNKNPFAEMYEMIQGGRENEPSFFIAKVINPLPNLEVSFNGIDLDKNNLMISKSLLLNYNANITSSEGTITHNLQDSLNVGDEVFLYRKNDIKFIVLDKVVSIGE